jgi:hypothetical protein
MSLRVVTLCSIGLTSFGIATAAGPKAVIEEKIYDAGDVQLGDVIEHTFLIKNEGDAMLRITEVRPSCHCTVPDYPPEVEPGKTGKIVVKVDTKTLQPQRQSKNVTVSTDAPGAERVVLAVNFNLSTALEFLPNSMVYLYVRQGEAREAQVLVRPHAPGMKLTSVVSDNPAIGVELVAVKTSGANAGKGIANQLTPRDGDSWVKIKLAGDQPVGELKGNIKVSTTDPKHREGTIVVRGKIEPAK